MKVTILCIYVSVPFLACRAVVLKLLILCITIIFLSPSSSSLNIKNPQNIFLPIDTVGLINNQEVKLQQVLQLEALTSIQCISTTHLTLTGST